LELSGGVGEGGEGADRVEQVLIDGGLAVEVFPGQLEPQFAGEYACPVTEPIQYPWFALVEPVVDDRAGQFRVVGPGTEVDVVRADRGPQVVHDACLCVNVNRCPRVVLDAVNTDPWAARGAEFI
jgi:hypothetical protein